MHTVMAYLKMLEAQADLGFTFEMEEDPTTPARVHVRASGFMPRDETVFAKIERDVQNVLNNLIVPPSPPKSVWQWIRENHYK